MDAQWITSESTYPLSCSSLCFPIMTSRFFFNDPATTEIYNLSLHDALPIWDRKYQTLTERREFQSTHELLREYAEAVDAQLPSSELDLPPPPAEGDEQATGAIEGQRRPDRKSTRLNSSHVEISYAVFCLKKK